jgi:hypothetical protein
LGFLKHVVKEGDWFAEGEQLSIDDRVYDGVGHRFTDEMLNEAVRWIAEVVGRSDRGTTPVWQSRDAAKPISPHL